MKVKSPSGVSSWSDSIVALSSVHTNPSIKVWMQEELLLADVNPIITSIRKTIYNFKGFTTGPATKARPPNLGLFYLAVFRTITLSSIGKKLHPQDDYLNVMRGLIWVIKHLKDNLYKWPLTKAPEKESFLWAENASISSNAIFNQIHEGRRALAQTQPT